MANKKNDEKGTSKKISRRKKNSENMKSILLKLQYWDDSRKHENNPQTQNFP